jgi:hypothetical protein
MIMWRRSPVHTRNRSLFQNRNKAMNFKSALEDLSKSTLTAVSGCLQKLEYLAGLRRQEDDYSHWGLGRVYGHTTANKALGEAHRDAVSKVLSTPLAKLLDDVETSAKSSGRTADEYLESLSRQNQALLPKNPGPGSARHLSSVLHALLGLERNRERNATRRAS